MQHKINTNKLLDKRPVGVPAGACLDDRSALAEVRLAKPEGLQALALVVTIDGTIHFFDLERDFNTVVMDDAQLKDSYDALRSAALRRLPTEEMLAVVAAGGTFSGKSMRPGLVRMLDAKGVSRLMGVEDAKLLWSSHSHLLHGTSVVPHAAARAFGHDLGQYC